METVLWFCLAALISSWGAVRYWQTLELEQPSLRAERNMGMGLWPIFVVIAPALLVMMLSRSLHIWMERPGLPSTLLAQFIPLVWLAIMLISSIPTLPTRRRLLSETWGFWPFFAEQVRTLIVFATGSLLLLFLPIIIQAWGLVVGIGAGIIINIWLWWQGSVIAWLMCAAPIPDQSQREACTALLRAPVLRLDGRAVTIAAIGHQNGGLINAMAVSGLWKCQIFISRRMLELLTPGETAAICSHELAHLEWRNQPWLLRYNAGWLLMTLAGLALSILSPTSIQWLPIAWMFMVLVLAVYLQLYQRREEVACDARALELGADASALASGLIKLHQANLIPRRMAAAVDQAMTHPSLARRLQAIRDLKGLPTGPMPPPLSIATTIGQLQLDENGLSYSSQPDTAEPDWRKPFSQLIELHLIPSSKGTKLVLREAEGSPLKLSLLPTDFSKLQDHLDQIDHALAPLPSKNLGIERWVVLIGLLILVATSINPSQILTKYQILMLFIPAFTLMFSQLHGTMLVLSALAVGLAFSIALEPGSFEIVKLLFLLGVGGAGLLGLSIFHISQHRFQPRSSIIWAMICLLMTTFAWLDAAIRPWDSNLFIHLIALGSERASLLVPLGALGAVLYFSGKRVRFLGAGIGIASLLLVAGTSMRLYPLINSITKQDPLAVSMPHPPQAARSIKFAERLLSSTAYGLHLFPKNEHFMVWLNGKEDGDKDKLVLGGFTDPLIETLADDADFHNGQWLTVRREAEHTRLTLFTAVEPTKNIWTLRLPAIEQSNEIVLWIKKEHEWTMTQWDHHNQWIGIYRGQIGTEAWHFDKNQPQQEDKTQEDKTMESSQPFTPPWRMQIVRDNGSTPNVVQRPWHKRILKRSFGASLVHLSGPQGATKDFITPGVLYCLTSADTTRLCVQYNRRRHSNSHFRYLRVKYQDKQHTL